MTDTTTTKRGRGRPKSTGEIRTEPVYLRLTPTEHSRLTAAALAAGETPAGYARRVVLADLGGPKP